MSDFHDLQEWQRILKESHEAIRSLERMARDGRGPVFTQAHVATSEAFMGIGKDTADFCAAIVALEKTTRKV